MNGHLSSKIIHRETGVLVQEVDRGQPCMSCDRCYHGFTPHSWRKTCQECKCCRDGHDVYHKEWVNVRERLGLKSETSEKPLSREKSYAQGFSWIPGCLPPYKVEQYFKCLPTEKVPKLGSEGEKYREKQIIHQLPKQDMALAYCRHVEPGNHNSYENFINARNEVAIDIAYVKDCTALTECQECGKLLNTNEIGVMAPKLGDKVMWHPACFVCSACKEILVDLCYCLHNDKIYCERHYAEQLKPRCAACDERVCLVGAKTAGICWGPGKAKDLAEVVFPQAPGSQ